jgi:hypothetical protein
MKPDGTETRGDRRRAVALIDTMPAENPIGRELSRLSSPEWLDKELGKQMRAEEEQKELECKGGFEILGSGPQPKIRADEDL